MRPFNWGAYAEAAVAHGELPRECLMAPTMFGSAYVVPTDYDARVRFYARHAGCRGRTSCLNPNPWAR